MKSAIGVARGGPKGPWLPRKFLENIVILCFKRRFSKQNSVIRLKSYTLAPTNFFGPHNFLGWLRHCNQQGMYVGGNSALKGFLLVCQLVQLQKQIQYLDLINCDRN